jgi:hypothetical protein
VLLGNLETPTPRQVMVILMPTIQHAADQVCTALHSRERDPDDPPLKLDS